MLAYTAVPSVILCARVRFQVLACVVMRQPGRRCISTVNVYSVRSEYTPAPRCLQRGFSASSRGSEPIHSAPATMANPDTGSSGEQSALTAQNIMEACLPACLAVWLTGRLAAHLDACLLCLCGCSDGWVDNVLGRWSCKVCLYIKET